MNRSIQILVIIIALLYSHFVYSQNVGINSTGAVPNTSAMLDVSSVTKGMLIPRMTHVQMNAITTPAIGLLVYDTDVPTGFYYYNGTTWIPLLSTAASATGGWSVVGNASTVDGTNFLGTTDSVAFSIRVNNQKAARIDPGLKNTFYGYKAGIANSTGINNIFEGQNAGIANTSGSSNFFMGSNAGSSTNTGNFNIAIGNAALKNNTTGTDEVAIGDSALYIPNSFDLFAIGNRAGKNTTTGFRNMYVGNDAGYNNTTGFYNIFFGGGAGYNNTTGTYNYVFGRAAFYLNKTSNYNTALGREAGYNHVSGDNNIFIGFFAGFADTSGVENTILGNNAAYDNLSGKYLTYMGYLAGSNNTTGSYNTFIGHTSGNANTTGNYNTFVGVNAGQTISTGSSNTFLGYQADGAATLTNATAIGANASVTTSNSMALGGTGASAINVGIGVTAPLTTLEVNGYTMLGSNAPQVKMIKFTGTSASTQGGSINVTHGLNVAKILSVEVLLDYGGGNVVPPSYHGSTGYEYNVFVTTTDIFIWNQTGNSASILSRPFRILVTYEQ